MKTEHYFTIYNLILPILGGFIGYFIKSYIDIKNEKNSKVYIERRDLYQTFVTLILSLNNENNILTIDFKNKLNEFYSKYILYASPKVINSFSDYITLLNSNNEKDISEKHIDNLSKILIDMRKDLGLNNKNLEGNKILKAINFK